MPLIYRTTSELLRALQAGDLSSVEVLDALLTRVETHDSAIHAVVSMAPETARRRAREADDARTRGESWGPLHGLPMTIKDSIEVVGMPTTSGAPELAQHMPPRNADAVQRLVDAGAIVFGKTNVPIFTGDFQSYNEIYGTTNNPWDPERTPGGSSGGSAAALAAGLTPLELGTDIGGSIRNPAHFCGVYGHKPSWGAVSARGNVPGPPGTLSPSDLVVLGPMARCADDLELALDVLSGPTPQDARAWRLDLPRSRHARLSGFRVALWIEQPGFPVAREVAERIQIAADRIAERVARFDDKARPALDPDDSHALYLRLLYSVIGRGRGAGALAEIGKQLAPSGPDSAEAWYGGSVEPYAAWIFDNEVRHQLRARWAEFFRDFDVLLCPIMPVTAFPHDHGPAAERTLQVDDREIRYFDPLFWAGLFTVAYLPATVVPVGRTREGLPVGMQVVAPYLEDRTAIHFARLIEELVGGFEAPPGFED